MKYPIGVQSFEKIRTGGFVYVDKSNLIYDLTENFQYVFLGRPRRFGKSLLMSTIHAYFEGRKDLFDGLAIESLATDWTAHPVLHFDLNTGDYQNGGVDEVRKVLNFQLERYEDIYGGIDDTPSNRLLYLIRRAYESTGQKVVVLIDEYDKPILSTLGTDAETEIRGVLKSYYACLKSSDDYIRFAMLTGVSKFGKLSVFSGLNNIEDISLNKQYATICGLTKEEILTYFDKQIDEFAAEREVSREQMIEDLRKKYDGYRFSPVKKLVFNPFSLLNSIKNRELKDYWFETGTPTFLVNLLKENNYDLTEIDSEEIDENSLYQIDDINAISLLYQTGYLTIKDYDNEWRMCKLGFPNQEVKAAFLNFLVPYYSSISSTKSMRELNSFVREVRSGDVEAFMQRLKSIFYSIPYATDKSQKVQEDQVRNLIFIIFKFLGIFIQVECPMSNGRSDAVVLTKHHIYVFEFKVDSTAEAAIRQIHEKHYAEPYRCDGRPITLIGLNYSTTARAITEWLTAPLNN